MQIISTSCTGKRTIIGRLPLPVPQLYIRAYRLRAPILPRPALAARSFSVSEHYSNYSIALSYFAAGDIKVGFGPRPNVKNSTLG